MRTTPFQLLVDAAGGKQVELLRLVNAALPADKQITPQAISKWANQIPADRVLFLVSLFEGKVRPEELRPDVFGEPTKVAA